MEEINDYQKFRDYLKSLSQEGNPFCCPLLRKMPDDIIYSGEGNFQLKKGDLICQGKPGSLGPVSKTIYCSVKESIVRLDPEGELEIKCVWNGSKFKFKLTDFEAKKS